MSNLSKSPEWIRALVGMVAIGLVVFYLVWCTYGLIALVKHFG
jgi:hypothetical protein